MHAAAVVAVEDQLGELVGVGFGTELRRAGRRRRARAPTTPPCARGRTRARGVASRRSRTRSRTHRALGAGALRRLLDVEAAGLREVDRAIRPVVAEVEDEVLRVAADAAAAWRRSASRATAPPSSAPRTRAARPPRARRRASSASRRSANACICGSSGIAPTTPLGRHAAATAATALHLAADLLPALLQVAERERLHARVDHERGPHRVGVGRGELRVDPDLPHDLLAVRLREVHVDRHHLLRACRGRARAIAVAPLRNIMFFTKSMSSFGARAP